ncbi:hypothetical protein GF318_00605 [Candidatus Micrarchaeota archaeon]|nr:hypothetical protein [Candidatus Micrarchaeota archaeon]
MHECINRQVEESNKQAAGEHKILIQKIAVAIDGVHIGQAMHRDLNAAINILKRATLRMKKHSQDGCEPKLTTTLGHRGSNACRDDCSSIVCEAGNGSPAL